MMNQLSFGTFKRSLVAFCPLDGNLRSFIEDADILQWRFARGAEVGIVDKSITPADEDTDGFEQAEEAIDDDEENNNRERRPLRGTLLRASEGDCSDSVNNHCYEVKVEERGNPADKLS